jgi:preprotein translocase subunit SecA
VLNAKPENSQREADIVAQAGQLDSVTVATNMAGRGVDILLGGNPEYLAQEEMRKKGLSELEHPQEWATIYQQKKAETDRAREQVVALGGLHIIGTERHEARRIDNQLRGRAGRQGDPGSSRFYVSLDDDIIKRFGGERIKGLMNMVGMDEDTPIENRLINRAIESAQVRTEGYHFDVRKHLVEFDDVVNKQRELIYTERRKTLGGADLRANILGMVEQEMCSAVASRGGGERGDGRDVKGMITEAGSVVPLPPGFNGDALAALKNEESEKEFGPENMRLLERVVMLRVIDSLWVEHLTLMEDMRHQAGWAGLQQVKSVDYYKNEGYKQFQLLLDTIRHDVAHTIFHVGIKQDAARQAIKEPVQSPMAKVNAPRARANAQPAGNKKVGRNDPCPCGSGKKYKHCHGR